MYINNQKLTVHFSEIADHCDLYYILSTIITPLCVSFRSNVLGSYSSSSLPSADEDSIRFMDDIEENIGADTAQGMYKNRIKNCRIFRPPSDGGLMIPPWTKNGGLVKRLVFFL